MLAIVRCDDDWEAFWIVRILQFGTPSPEAIALNRLCSNYTAVPIFDNENVITPTALPLDPSQKQFIVEDEVKVEIAPRVQKKKPSGATRRSTRNIPQPPAKPTTQKKKATTKQKPKTPAEIEKEKDEIATAKKQNEILQLRMKTDTHLRQSELAGDETEVFNQYVKIDWYHYCTQKPSLESAVTEDMSVEQRRARKHRILSEFKNTVYAPMSESKNEAEVLESQTQWPFLLPVTQLIYWNVKSAILTTQDSKLRQKVYDMICDDITHEDYSAE